MGDDLDLKGYDLNDPKQKEAAMTIISESVDKAASDMFIEFVNEISTILKTRNCKTNSAVGGAVSELNDRWNAMIPMFEKEYKFSPIKRNAVNRFWAKKIPGLEMYLRGGLEE